MGGARSCSILQRAGCDRTQKRKPIERQANRKANFSRRTPQKISAKRR
jgi:hypothetical protein